MSAVLLRMHGGSRSPRLVGSRVDRQRRHHDFYPTPPSATEALLSVERFDGDVLEPACGDGSMARVLAAAGLPVRATDLVDYGFGEAGLDFVGVGYPYRAANVITNPPFKLAGEFIRRGLDCADRKVAMFLRLGFLEGQERGRLFRSTPLARVWVFSSRVTFPVPGMERPGQGMLAFAWFVWDREYSGPPQLGWLP